MLQPNTQNTFNDQSVTGGRNHARQRTNIIMTGNQIVGGNLNYPKTTRNNAPQQIMLGQKSPAEDGTSISQFGDNSLMIEGKK